MKKDRTKFVSICVIKWKVSFYCERDVSSCIYVTHVFLSPSLPLVQSMAVFRYSLRVLNIYNARYVYYRF